ncbi:MAG: glycosyltransferase family 1 protein [Candidatus Paceibacterota bacterium]|jgi:glycosyltransferase involved in cell wall biosynthesis
MKKILIVTDAWAPQVNGVPRVLLAHKRCLEERGYIVDVIEPGQFKMTYPMPTYPEIRLALFPRRRVRQMIEEFQPDAVHLPTEGPLGWAARAVCIKNGIPFTTQYHTRYQLYVDMRFRGLLRPAHAFLRHFHSRAMCTMVSTESLKKELESEGFKNVVVVPLGVDTKLFTRNPTPPLPPLPKPVFVYFSRLAPEKSPEEFLKLDLPGTKLVIGDGPDRKRLEEKYGKKNTFIGYKHGQELVDWLSLCDVFVFPSRTETFGLVVLEALACGLRVAAHDAMGPRDSVTEGKDGYLGEDLQEVAIKCLELSPADCRKKAGQYTWEHSTDLFLQNLAFIHQ